MRDKIKAVVSKIRHAALWIWLNLVDIAGWFRNAWIWAFADITRPRTFTGFGTWYFAVKYSHKRARRWRPEWDQSGRQQGLFPIDQVHLLVASEMELKALKKKGYVKGNPRKILKRQSYYTTK